MLTGEALGCCVTVQFYSTELWLSPQGVRVSGYIPFSSPVSGVSLLSIAAPNSRNSKKIKYFSATYSRITLNL